MVKKLILILFPLFLVQITLGQFSIAYAAKKATKSTKTTQKKASSSKPSQKNLTPPKEVAPNKPKLLGTYGNWQAYVSAENGKKVCYMTSFAEKETGQYAKRGDVYLLITHRPYLKSYNVVSFDAGYSFKSGTQADVTTTTGGKNQTFKLFTDKETAWCPDPQTDKNLTLAIINGSKIVVTGVSTRDTKTTDVYSLKGSQAAYMAICKACDVKAAG